VNENVVFMSINLLTENADICVIQNNKKKSINIYIIYFIKNKRFIDIIWSFILTESNITRDENEQKKHWVIESFDEINEQKRKMNI
jgi:hypothetical protein